MVNSANGLGDQPKVINSFSDLMVKASREAGHHGTSAVAAAELLVAIAMK